MRRSHELARALRSARDALPIALSAALLGANWLVFIFAVQTDRITDTSLGYYVNPLVSVALGFVVLGERLRPGQWLAVAVAAAGVAWWTARLGGLPWISAALAVSFALYGLVRKLVPISSLAGFALEMLFLAPLAAVFLAVQPAGSLALPGASAGVGALARGVGARDRGAARVLRERHAPAPAHRDRHLPVHLAEPGAPARGALVRRAVHARPRDRVRIRRGRAVDLHPRRAAHRRASLPRRQPTP